MQISAAFRLGPIFVSLIFGTLFLFAQAYAEKADGSSYEISDSEVQTIKSETLGRSYDLFIKFPPGYYAKENAEVRYPVIYLNDAGYCWETAVGVTRAPFNFGGYEKAVLVGVSYANGEDARESRARDLTPTKVAGAKLVHGGARDYLTFFRDEVIPFIDSNYRSDTDRRMIAGQSYGGLFGAYALLEEPGLFHDYILTSPSLWHNNKVMFEFEAWAAKAGKQLQGRVYFAIGETETPTINGGRYDMVGQQTEFANRLRSRGYENLIVRDEILEGGTHLTTFPIGFTRALRWLLPGDNIYGG